MTSIEQTVQQSLPAGLQAYASQAQPVITALRDREQNIVGQIIEFAAQQGFSRDRARTVLSDLGMEVPTDQPSMTAVAQQPDQQPGEADLAATLGRIETTLSGLLGFARENGYRG